jgi:hypothetical protein
MRVNSIQNNVEALATRHMPTLAPGIGLALLASVLWILGFLQYRQSFKGILAAMPGS